MGYSFEVSSIEKVEKTSFEFYLRDHSQKTLDKNTDIMNNERFEKFSERSLKTIV